MIHIGGISFDLDFFLKYLVNPPEMIWYGILMTIAIAIIAQVAGVVLGFGVAIARLSKFAVLRALAGLYSWAWRGTPVLVQLLIVYTGVAAAGVYRYPEIALGPLLIAGPLQAALITLSLNEAAYMGEIFRGAIQTIDRGQIDAARAIGMRPSTAMRWVILPQAMRTVIPPLGNEFTLMIKGTSLLSVIGVRELFGSVQNINSATFKTFELFLIAAIWYLAMTTVLSIVQRFVEARLRRHELPAAATVKPNRSLLSAR
ncbi:amino acid ABC transporter permease [Dongia soli]|uniref:Amino acid ABC transporter permease n=1 Tax=Dongia soli TaxID=600628 RepID=A0ABU5EG35_9PROT|nr:amino acid ABC transporter permease [Dongia soli]MDY0884403.1 amino acid ABC transporter permease [Dongia soli]